ncbi:hypothetical protein FNV43_RR21044 [Rhamnella rubrinervis]|uniref:Uncharacterized protein n=1 Tax=Rhamnella rubrinervis TaxID=2594499 RepID=A0A8K0GV36_9ROSA|nr:hypothetical protein FNV43_RR21044 [Rhamnella rubrinervis]
MTPRGKAVATKTKMVVKSRSTENVRTQPSTPHSMNPSIEVPKEPTPFMDVPSSSNPKKLYIIGRLRPLNADEEFVYELNEDFPIPPLKKKRGCMNIDTEKEEYVYFHQQDTFNFGGTLFEDVGQPSHSSHNYDELKSHIQYLDIKIDGVTNDLGNFLLDSMREFQSIHETMHQMLYYIKHEYHPTEHATHNDDVNKDAAMGGDFETRDLNMGVVERDSEVQWLTLSKVVHHEPRVKKRAERLKSPCIVTTEI